MEDPTFDSFYATQKSPHSHQGSGSSSYNPYPPAGFASSPAPLSEEPVTLGRSNSNASIHSQHSFHRHRAESSASMTSQPRGNTGDSASRQGSFPYVETSTLLATAPKNGQKQGPPMQHTASGQGMYSAGMYNAAYGSAPPSGQYWANDQSWQTNAYGQDNMSTAASMGDSQYSYDQASPYNQAGMTPATNGWESEYLNPSGTPGMSNGQQGDGGFTRDDQDELERIISRHSSRSASPMPQQNDHLQNQQAAMLNAGEASAHGSRSSSPFPTTNPAGPSSPFNKPQSPPALVIPNVATPSSAPALPPIVTQTPGSNSTRSGTQLAGAGFTGGLLPPTNPALQHLEGMMGISPIAPNADGPQIFVQPSTPISGLRDGRGLFDAALRRAGQMAQANQNGQGAQGGGTNGTGDNNTQYNSNDPSAAPQPDYNAMMQQPPYAQWANFNALNANFSPSGAASNTMRPRAKSDSFTPASGVNMPELERQAFLQYMSQLDPTGQMGMAGSSMQGQENGGMDINAWRNLISMGQGGTGEGGDGQFGAGQSGPAPTLDPRQLPGNTDHNADLLRAFQQQHQLSQLQAQKARMAPLNVNVNSTPGGGGVFKYEPGEFSPTSLAFYQQLGLSSADASQLATASAPFHTTTFQNLPQQQVWPQTAAPGQSSFLVPAQGERRRSFAEGTSHPSAGAGTPGYGIGMANHLGGVHRRAARSEDFGRPGLGDMGTGWGMGAGGSTSDFLNSITANDGTLLPPSRGRSGSHSRHSSVSSVRSASPALSISSQGSSYGETSGRMDMPDGTSLAGVYGGGMMNQGGVGPTRKPARVAKMKVTSMATEVASTSRRTNEGVFKCPVPGCGSTFTRHFNLKGHLRSHNDERPYKCLYDGCPKSVVGFARQHDCKRHMALHVGLRPFECEGCGKKFARLDALTRHHKSEQGQECAISHPLPTNPDGSAMSESQYKQYRIAKEKLLPGGGVIRRPSFGSMFSHSGDERSGGEEEYGTGSGMEDYDRY